MTLPLILALRDSSPKERRDLLEILQEPEALTEREIACVREAISQHDGYARTAAVARDYVSLAQAALSALPPSPYRDALCGLADYALTRER